MVGLLKLEECVQITDNTFIYFLNVHLRTRCWLFPGKEEREGIQGGTHNWFCNLQKGKKGIITRRIIKKINDRHINFTCTCSLKRFLQKKLYTRILSSLNLSCFFLLMYVSLLHLYFIQQLDNNIILCTLYCRVCSLLRVRRS